MHSTRYGRQQKSACRFSLNSKLKLIAKGELREMKCLPPPPDTAQNNLSLDFGTFRLGKTHVPKKGNLAQPRLDEAYFLKHGNYIFRRGQTVFLAHTCKNEHFSSTRCVFWLNTTQCLIRFLLFTVFASPKLRSRPGPPRNTSRPARACKLFGRNLTPYILQTANTSRPARVGKNLRRNLTSYILQTAST